MSKRIGAHKPAPRPRSRAYVVFNAGIAPAAVNQLIQALTSLSQNGVDEAYLAYSSLGGSFKDGFALYNFLRAAPFKLIMHNCGAVESMGVPAFLAAETRYASPVSTFRFHRFHWATANRNYVAVELQEMIDGINAHQGLAESILVERSDVTDDQAKNFFREGKTLLPEEAHQLGVIHEIRELSIPKGAQVLTITAT